MKIQIINGSYYVNIPKAIAKLMRWDKGDRLRFENVKGKLVLEKEESNN